MRIPWTVWKGKKIWYGKVSPLGWKVFSRLLGNSSWAIKTLKDDAVKVLHAVHQQIWKTQQWPQDWRRSLFIPVSKKGNTKECSGYPTVVLISHTSEAMFKILQARLQKYVDQKLPDTQARFWRGRGTRNQIANICWIMEKARKFQKNICFIDYVKVFVWITKNCGKFLKRWEYQTTLPVFLNILYAEQEATMDWFTIRKEYSKGVYCHPAYLTSMQSTSCEIPS